MSIEIALVVAAVLVLVGFWLGWKVVQGRMRGDDETPAAPPIAEAPVAVPIAEAPVAPPIVEAPVAKVEAPAVAPMPPSVVAPAPVASPPPPPTPPALDAPVPVTVIMAPRPAAPVIERVLAVEPASQAEWDAAVPLTLSAVQSASVMATLAAGASPAFYAIGFDAGAAIAVGRGDQTFMRTLASAAAKSPSGRWLDSAAAATLAATALAGLANERFLEALGDDVRDLKTELAALPPKLAASGDGRLKTLIQDLSRFAREARDNYASALGKAAFRERVDEGAERALAIWRDLVERTDGVRQQIEVLTRAQRFGEAQVEKALALLRELGDLARWQGISARTLAAAQVLRVVMGELPTSSGADPLASAAAALQAGLDQDRDQALRLSDCEKSARGDPYVGKAEFEANRAALRKLVARPMAERVTPSLERLEAARTAEALDPLGAPRRRLLIRASSQACTMRWSAGAG